MPAHASATPAHASGTPVAHWHARAHLGASVSRRVGVEQWNTADSLARTRYCLRHTALCAVACCGLLCTMIGSLGHIRTSWHSRTHQDTPAHASATPEHASSTPETSRGTPEARLGHAWTRCTARSAVAYGFAVGFAAGDAHSHLCLAVRSMTLYYATLLI